MQADDIKSRVSIEDIFMHYDSTKDNNGKWRCLFPSNHTNGDAHHSVGPYQGRAFCRSRECFGPKGSDIFEIVGLLESLPNFADQKVWIETNFGLNHKKPQPANILRTFEWTDAEDRTAYHLRVNTDSKFKWNQTADGTGKWTLKPCQPDLYQRDQVLAATNIIVAAGERDCDTLNRWLRELEKYPATVATCNHTGESSVKAESFHLLHGKQMIFVIGDNDTTGESYRTGVCGFLRGKVDALYTLQIPPQFNDITEWAENGATAEDFAQLLEGGESVQALEATDNAQDEEESAQRQNQEPMSWPELDKAALHGLAGEIVTAIAPYTEADRVTLLVHLLSEFSCIIGRGPHIRLDGDFVPLLFWPVVVGKTSKARKGVGSKRAKRLFQAACPNWTRGKHSGSLSSGEGLIYAVRDEEWGENAKGARVLKDEGIEDKRLYLVQSEFGSMLRIMGRDGNSLSGHLRDAWDGAVLKPMTKGSRISATNPHIVVAGHVTQTELLRNQNSTEMCNGFGNRFVWFCVKRSKFLPFADNPPVEILMGCIEKLQQAIKSAEHVEEIGMTEKAKEWWRKGYEELSQGTPGLAGGLLDRAEAQVRRLAAVYALLDSRPIVNTPHLYAALSLWEYSVESVKWIFGDKVGDPIADAILEAVRRSEEGLTDTDLSNLFSRHESAERLSQAKSYLQTQSLIEPIPQATKGRPSVVWVAKKAKEAKKSND